LLKNFQVGVGTRKSLEAANKLKTPTVQLSGVQRAADLELRELRRMWSCW